MITKGYIIKLNIQKFRGVKILLAMGLTFMMSTEVLAEQERKPSVIDSALFRSAEFKDAELCSKVAVKTVQGRPEIIFPKAITNPAATCPDAYSWKVFLEAIRDEFWRNWAYDSYSWPAEPYRMCATGEDPLQNSCCSPDTKSNPGYEESENPGTHCPYYPGNYKNPVLGLTQTPLKQTVGHPGGVTFPKAKGVHNSGLIIRQSMAEVVYRNKPMWHYIFENNLYNKQGLGEYFNAANTQMSVDAPYHVSQVDGVKANVQFPQGSVMFKGDWLHEDRMKEVFPDFDPKKAQNEYITMKMISSVGDNDPGLFKPGIHYLVSLTIGSKDLPNWLWFTIEHKDNIGRCDYTGCNDSFGYQVEATEGISYAKENFMPPYVKSDGLPIARPVFVTNLQYPGGNINPTLRKMMDAFGIGISVKNSLDMPSLGDYAWQNYRLKGSQSTYVNNHGEATILGNSVTEGGFVQTSSCLTCHARASIDGKGNPGNDGGFIPNVDIAGYSQSPHGIPNPAWFMRYEENPSLLSAQFDFVWGILFAKDLVEPKL